MRPQGPVSTDNVLRLLEYQHHRCALTGRELTPETAALDHIIPIRCDGQHVIENTQVLHSDVNRAKGSLTNVEFIQLCREVAAHTAGQHLDESHE
jgi:5-methylcytosine-specific restriction endonuclease McrA